MENWRKILKIEIDINKARDTGMALVLILLLLQLFIGSRLFLKIVIPVLVVNMIVPQIFYPLAYIWFGLAQLLGTFFSKVLLFLVYILMVLPVGIFRRMMGKDQLLLRKWKKGTDSVFRLRDHLYSASDLDKPY